MNANHTAIRFRPLRLLFVCLLTSALGVAVVHETEPERNFDRPTIAADVEVRVVPRLVPTADAVRREALSSDNLAAVCRRLKKVASQSASPAESSISETIGLWRRHIAVEVHDVGDPDRRRIRFLAEGFSDAEQAAAVVEAVATHYSGNLSAERWYASVDRLRAAEEACDVAARELLVAVERAKPIANTVERREGPNLLSTVDPADSVRREMSRLVELRSQLMESLQPAHPQILALDARLVNLQATASAMSPIRRLSAEAEADAPAIAEPADSDRATSEAAAKQSERTAASLAAVSAATSRLITLRTAVHQELNSMLDPAAAEFPVVAASASGISLWSKRETWYAVAGLSGLVVGLIVLARQLTKVRAASSNAAEPNVDRAAPPSSGASSFEQSSVGEVFNRTSPSSGDRSNRPLTDVDEATELTGAPVLAVLRRRLQTSTATPRPSGF